MYTLEKCMVTVNADWTGYLIYSIELEPCQNSWHSNSYLISEDKYEASKREIYDLYSM